MKAKGAALVLLLAGCGGGGARVPAPATPPPVAPEAPAPLRFGAVGHALAVTVEHAPLVAGRPAVLSIRVTLRATGGPLPEGPVGFLAFGPGGAEIQQAEEAQAAPGLYRPLFRFAVPGSWRLAMKIPYAGGAEIIPLPSFEVAPDPSF